MSSISKNILVETLRKIKNDLPDFIRLSMIKLFPFLFITSILEIFGLVIIFPVINILMDPTSIQTNKVLHTIYTSLQFTDQVTFVLCLMCSITAFFLIKNAIIYFCTKIQTRIAFRAASRLAYENYSYYLSESYEYFADNNTALMLRNFSQIPFELIAFVILPFTVIINELFILAILVIIMSFFDPILFSSILIFALPFVFIYNLVFRKKLREISDRKNKESSSIYKSGMQAMEGFREIVVFNKLSYFKPRFKRTVEMYSRSLSSVYLLNIFSPKIVESVAVLCISGIFMAGYLFGKDIIALGQFLVVFSLAAYRVIPSMNKIILSGNYIKSSFFTLDYFNKEKHMSSEMDSSSDIRSSSKILFTNELSIKNLSFKYKNAKETVLREIDLTLKKGETIGIIGPSGSGKTTLLNILLRLYKEQEGGIYVDNQKIDDANLYSWYQLVSYVPQNITLLDGTIAENIAFGMERSKVDKELLSKVIDRAQLRDLINDLPNKTESLIGENGIKLSGGQRQRIGIARALYHGGEILIFDEATSALDHETERILSESIHSISHQDLTIIIVAHRLETLKYCDRIYKIEKGQLLNDK